MRLQCPFQLKNYYAQMHLSTCTWISPTLKHMIKVHPHRPAKSMGFSLGNILDYLEDTALNEHESMKSIMLEVLGFLLALPVPLDDTLSSPTQVLNGTSLEESDTRQRPSRWSKKCPTS